ncbi:MAG: potassium channel family protein [Sphingomonas bacterium]|nr:potassium channel family protein [Sphingomonas bacterium]
MMAPMRPAGQRFSGKRGERSVSATREGDLVLDRRSGIGVWQSLGFRALLVAGLLGIALLGHWLDREGLRDNADGSISFLDIVYFTTVTVTTVGYGDIVPVTSTARMFDTFVVTPIRLFVWLIFLGSAYTFVLRHSWQKIRTKIIGRALDDHYIICGYGAGGSAATEELLREGIDPTRILVIDKDAERVTLARSIGVTVLEGDATHDETLETGFVARAHSVLVSMGRDDTAALVVLSARRLNPDVPISVSIRAAENEDLLRQAGARSVINPVSLGGHLLARSSQSVHAVDCLRDLASADGRVVIVERAAKADEVGVALRAITSGLGLRLIRDGDVIGVLDQGEPVIRDGDTIVEIVAVARR